MKPNQNNRLRGDSLRPGDSIEAFLAHLRAGQQAMNEAELRLKADPALWNHLPPELRAQIEMMRALAKDMPQPPN